jgi:hypothetical protein
MTPEFLIAEGRRLARPCLALSPNGSGSVIAVWHEPDKRETEETGFRHWMTIDSRLVPRLGPLPSRYLSILTDERECQGGRVELLDSVPNAAGVELYATQIEVLPPIEAVFARGSDEIGTWLAVHDWPRVEWYNDNFPDRKIVSVYLRQWMSEYPLYLQDDAYAVLGGWHLPCADDDWYELIDDVLISLTLRDAEPWVEAWRLKSGEFKVIQRIT